MNKNNPLSTPQKNTLNPFLSLYFNSLMAIKRLSHIEAFAGIILIFSALAALFWANSAYHSSYGEFWHTDFGVSLGDYTLKWNLHFWVNDVLMTFFFLSAGLEIRKELHDGALSNVKQALLPLIAAIGGVIMPALIYMLFNTALIYHHGWAVPTATDIAFAVGILALLGRSLPANIRVALLSLAIIDDILAVLIIAIFYSNGLDVSGLFTAGGAIGFILLMQFLGFSSSFPYLLPGAFLWFGLWKAGIHPSLTGVILGLLTPIIYRPLKIDMNNTQQRATLHPLNHVEKHLNPFVAFLIMPVFALTNAGIYFGDIDLNADGTISITMGIISGLLIGKPLGIMSISYIAVKLGICRLPPKVDWKAMLLIGLLAGIGFTMAIFVAMLAFTNPEHLASAKVGVLIGSALSAFLGLSYGLYYTRTLKRRQNCEDK